MYLQMGQVGLVVVSSREAAREVMKVQDANFAHRPELAGPKVLLYGCADVAFSSGGPTWRRLRKVCVVKLLSANRVRSFAPIRREETRRLLESIAGHCPGKAIDLRAMVDVFSSAIVSRTALSETFEHRGSILKKGLELASGFNLSDHFPSLSFLDVLLRHRLRRMQRQVDKLFEDVIEERKWLRQKKKKKDTTEDMLDVLLDAMEHPEDTEVPITHDNIKAVIMDMFAAGTETSSSTIEWALAELMKNPKEMAKVQDEVRTKMEAVTSWCDIGHLSYLRLVVKETMRLHMPAPLLVPRVCKEQCRVGGYMIPAGSRVVINAWAMGRDPRYWEDAEAFRPGRFLGTSVDFKGGDFEFLPFGAGRRMCPGIEFGLAGVELCLAQLLFSFDWTLPGGIAPEDLDMSETSVGALSVVRKEPLRLIPSIHAPLHLNY
ncbi:5-epiaristolochene 1,3-dihydroxylase-like [Triticum dicoccoides]|uniref:5-epiaristolochene 1,3-dihydroxylase-like n=1 Tax=Triticum dicoccoides TaxID=85692 RepID=UPI00188F5D58|nr:5-epiaristolochene 1,3-dihydroxylase-like [Triticum dicoccoides]